MILCSRCAVPLRCHKNEKVVRMGKSEIYYGDEYRCTKCDYFIVTGFGAPIMPWHINYSDCEKEIEIEGRYE